MSHAAVRPGYVGDLLTDPDGINACKDPDGINACKVQTVSTSSWTTSRSGIVTLSARFFQFETPSTDREESWKVWGEIVEGKVCGGGGASCTMSHALPTAPS